MKKLDDTRLGRFLSLVLRHKPEIIDISLDKNGWADVEELIEKIKLSGRYIDIKILERIVIENDKKRYRFNDDKTKIRAIQGHSIKIESCFQEMNPPDILYHGTSKKYLENIVEKGILKRKGQYVHLFSNIKTAVNVGGRHGESLVLTIDTEAMRKKGYKFYLSDNGIWLSNNIPSEFITVTNIEDFLKRYTYIKQEIKRIKKLAMKGSPMEQFELALLYEKGLGVRQDYYKAFRLYNAVIDNEYSYDNHYDRITEYIAALYKLGELYEKGLGVKQDYVEAKIHYRNSASYFYEETLLRIKEKPLPKGKEEGARLLKMYKKYIDKCPGLVQLWLAEVYENGFGIEQNYKEAMKLYKKVAEQGNHEALFKIGYFYEEGLGVKQSYRKAFNLYKKFAKLGNRAAQYKLGEYYGEGYVVGRSNKKAIKYYKECDFNIIKFINNKTNYLESIFKE